VRPGPAQQAQHAPDYGGALPSRGSLARAQHGGDEFARQPLEEKQRQVAMAVVVMVVEGQFLLAVGAVFGVVHVQHDDARGLRVTGDEALDEGPGQTVDVFAAEAVLQAREGRPRGQRSGFIQRCTPQRQFEHGVAAQAVGVIAVDIATGALVDPLAQQVGDAVLDVGRMPTVMDRRRQAADQPALLFDATQQQWAKVARKRAAFEVGAHGKAGDSRKAQLARGRSTHGGLV